MVIMARIRTILQEYLAHNSTAALNLVSDFIGLDKYDWEQHHIVSFLTHGSLHETANDIPAPPELIARIKGFYDKFPHKYIDHVMANGFWGCRPAIRHDQ